MATRATHDCDRCGAERIERDGMVVVTLVVDTRCDSVDGHTCDVESKIELCCACAAEEIFDLLPVDHGKRRDWIAGIARLAGQTAKRRT